MTFKLREWFNQFKRDLVQELDWDEENANNLSFKISRKMKDVNNSRASSSDTNDESEEDSDAETDSDEGSDHDEEPPNNEDIRMKPLKCCLCCACCDCLICFSVPGSRICDAIYHKYQRKINDCPQACPTCIPRSIDEEWRFKGRYGARFALCECCAMPQCIVLLKWLDAFFCPCCALWEILKGIDFGYRRFRIQAYIHRHHEAEKGHVTSCV